MMWGLWALLLVLQNASFTWVSRARNSSSLSYHAVASVASNGIWFICQVFLIREFFALFETRDWNRLAVLFAFYTVCTVVGSVCMHWVSMRYLETGKRRVGAAK